MKFLACVQKTINPRKQFAGSMIRMKNNGDIISFCHGMNMHSSRNRPSNGSFLLIIGKALTCVKNSTTIGKLDHNGRIDCCCSLKHRIHGIRAYHIHRGQCILIFLSVVKNSLDTVTGDYSSWKFLTHNYWNSKFLFGICIKFKQNKILKKAEKGLLLQ